MQAVFLAGHELNASLLVLLDAIAKGGLVDKQTLAAVEPSLRDEDAAIRLAAARITVKVELNHPAVVAIFIEVLLGLPRRRHCASGRRGR